ncbi:glycosyltransferase family A protein [Chryseobacterium mulctrae]|uniref:glycosyltransferase family A protein n=1 Tax=Chryseobacterium mulctrae TaxID=2576777 RepID=UPI00111661E3|nr:glycosyltransferase family 2 protein [Chryseobacterium mulctrae]
MLLTIFTPTYNRAHLLPSLFSSLQKQGIKNFEWLIVDDGSEDDTVGTVAKFQKETNFPINYIYQENQGKHVAINTGVKNASTELFLTVDSDDEIMENAIEKTLVLLPSFLENQNIAAICFPIYSDNTKKTITNKEIEFNQAVLNSIELKNNYGITGEFTYLFKTKILKQYPFPYFAGEKFVKESVVYKRIDRIYKNMYVNQSIVKAEYLEGGLSSNFRNLMEKNPKGSALAYLEIVNDKRLSFEERKEAFSHYWYFENISKQHSLLQRLFHVKNKDIIFDFILKKLK